MNKALFTTLVLTAQLGLSAHAADFSKACEAGGRSDINIAAVGDIIFHSRLKRAVNNYDFEKIWKGVTPLLKNSNIDLLYGNYEGAVSYKGNEPTTKQMVFKYHPKTVSDLRRAGFDVLSTANNHSLDAGIDGVYATVSEMNSNGVGFTGTRTADQNAASVSTWSTVRSVNGKRVAFLACTESTNGIRDSKQLVLRCNSKNVTAFVSQLARSYDAVIVTPHWGQEGTRRLNSQQIKMASSWARAGAVAIIGNHSHLVGEIQSLPVKDANGRIVREALVISSLGNFISNQPAGIVGQGSRPDFGAILYFGITLTRNGATISGYRFVPTVFDRGEVRVKAQGLNINSKVAVNYVSKYLQVSKMLDSINTLSSELSCR